MQFLELSKVFLNIEKHVSLNENERQKIAFKFKVENFTKDTIILEQSKIAKRLFFVEFGSLRAYNSNKNGKESTIMFAVTDWWITDMSSFINQKPALLSLETLEDSRLCSIEFTALEQLYIQIPKLERFFRIIFQKAYVREQMRTLDTISLTVEQRYLGFILNYPQITSRITQKQIASYLGVTPEFLSSIKKNISS